MYKILVFLFTYCIIFFVIKQNGFVFVNYETFRFDFADFLWWSDYSVSFKKRYYTPYQPTDVQCVWLVNYYPSLDALSEIHRFLAHRNYSVLAMDNKNRLLNLSFQCQPSDFYVRHTNSCFFITNSFESLFKM